MSPLTRLSFLAASAAALAAPALRADDRPKKLVMIAGAPSHGPLEHEFNAGTQLLAKCLAGVKGLRLSVHLSGWPKQGESAFEGADGILLYADGGGGHPFAQGNRLQFLNEILLKRGVGLMCAHYGVEVLKDKGCPECQ